MLIYKTQLPLDTWDFKTVKLPFPDAEAARKAVLHLDIQYDLPCLWYQADVSDQEKEFLLIAIGTGHDWGSKLRREEYIGSLLLMDGTLVLHYFLVEAPEGEEKESDKEKIF